MIAITTNSSISVNPPRRPGGRPLSERIDPAGTLPPIASLFCFVIIFIFTNFHSGGEARRRATLSRDGGSLTQPMSTPNRFVRFGLRRTSRYRSRDIPVRSRAPKRSLRAERSAFRRGGARSGGGNRFVHKRHGNSCLWNSIKSRSSRTICQMAYMPPAGDEA